MKISSRSLECPQHLSWSFLDHTNYKDLKSFWEYECVMLLMWHLSAHLKAFRSPLVDLATDLIDKQVGSGWCVSRLVWLPRQGMIAWSSINLNLTYSLNSLLSVALIYFWFPWQPKSLRSQISSTLILTNDISFL